MTGEEYSLDPCRASSLPFWKAERIVVPKHVSILRDDAFSAEACTGRDEPYFKLKHDLKSVSAPALPERFEVVPCDTAGFARHINECYAEEGVTEAELSAYRSRPVYAPELWLAVAEKESGRIAATGIAELDRRIGEGILEWIQVSPGHRRAGLGKFIVSSLLSRLRDRARFVTVSGRMNSESDPFALYVSCGFADPVVWHIVTTR